MAEKRCSYCEHRIEGDWEVMIPFHNMDRNAANEWKQKIRKVINKELDIREIYLRRVDE